MYALFLNVYAPSKEEYNLLNRGDHIGAESHIDFMTDLLRVPLFNKDDVENKRRRRSKRDEKEEKTEYPPLMPSLLSAELPVLKKHCIDHGHRILIKTGNLTNRSFLRSVTPDGRLRLFLLHQFNLDDRNISGVVEGKDDLPTGDDVNPHFGNHQSEGDETPAAIGDSVDSEIDYPRVKGNGEVRRMCLRYKMAESSDSCMFGTIPLPAIPPIQI